MKKFLKSQNVEHATTVESSDLNYDTEDNVPIVNIKKKRNLKKFITIAVIIAIVIGGSTFALKLIGKQKSNASSKYTTETVTTRSIIDELSVSGTLAPANSYTVSTLNEGKIITDKDNEGDKVKKGDTLYTIDSTDATNTIARGKVNLSNAQLAYKTKLESKEDLKVKSSVDGTVTDIAVEVGDKIKAGQTVATVVNSSTMSIVLPFLSINAQKFSIGEKATLTLNGSYENLTGTISKIKNVDTALSNFQVVRYVTIDVTNQGAISDTTVATAVVGGVQSTTSGTFTYKAKATITAAVDGTVAQINTAEGDKVSKHQRLVTLTSSSLDQEIISAYNALTMQHWLLQMITRT